MTMPFFSAIALRTSKLRSRNSSVPFLTHESQIPTLCSFRKRMFVSPEIIQTSSTLTPSTQVYFEETVWT
ncbi:hypothetical protein D3C80_1975870 [compost metagenome]